MSNNWFRFKKFFIRQDKTAMKVGTDGVLLGSWVTVSQTRRILDVGTGTGLIALMIAQRSDAVIDAIEIDPEAAIQAAENVAGSPWAEKITVISSSFQDFCKNTSSRYDLVVCNPPFFKHSLKAKTYPRTLARHNDQLDLQELISGSKSLLTPQGRLCVILPADTENEMIELSQKDNLFPARILRIRPVPGKDFKRVLIDFSSAPAETDISGMTIESGVRNQFSPEYVKLTKDYYL